MVGSVCHTQTCQPFDQMFPFFTSLSHVRYQPGTCKILGDNSFIFFTVLEAGNSSPDLKSEGPRLRVK